MKRLISILLAFSLIFSLSACGSGDSAAPAVKDEPASLTYPYNIVNRPMRVDDVYDYKTVCYSDRSLTTDGHIYIYDYIIEPAGDGMVDKTVKAMFIFDDDNAWNHGMSFNVLYADFVKDEVIGGDGEWTVQIDGTDYTVTVLQDEFISGSWTPMSNYVSKYVLKIRMPEGYDDIGLFFYNTQNKLNVAGEADDVPDGTPINKLVDSHSQWFVLGGKGDDWETTKTPTYYGSKIEAQVNNIAIEDVLGGTPVFDVPDDADENGAPPPPPEDLDFPYIEIAGLSKSVLKRDGISELDVDFDMHNCPEGSYFEATAFADNMPEVIEVKKDSAYVYGSDILRWSVFFDIDGRQIPADSVCVELAVYDADDNLLDMTKIDVPFDKPYEEKDTQPVVEDDTDRNDGDIDPYVSLVEITDWSCDYISADGVTELEISRSTYNWFEGDVLEIKYCTDADQLIDQYEYEITGNNKKQVDHGIFAEITGEELTGDTFFVVLTMKYSDGAEISVAELELPIK